MSSFVVNGSTIDRIVWFINQMRAGEGVRYPHAGHAVASLMPHLVERDTPNARMLTTAGRAILAMNTDCVYAMYGECEINPADYQYSTVNEPPASLGITRKLAIGVYKAIDCLLYQCAGAAGTGLYQALCDLQSGIAADLVENSDEYEQAVWG